jgi:hypothetical protein
MLGRRQRKDIVLPYSGMGGARRPREGQRREYQATVRLSEAELTTMTAAADRRELAFAAYLVQAGMDVAEHRAGSITDMQREALAELIAVGQLLRDLHKATAQRNATSQRGADLSPVSAAYCMQVARRADEAIVMICKSLR